MKYPFDTSETLIGEFENVLRKNGLKIEADSDLERISLIVFETNSKHKKEIIHSNIIDIRPNFSDVAGLVDFVTKIVKQKDHPDFKTIIPHLHKLNTASTAVMTSISKVSDDGNNKLMELYMALLCMAFATNIRLDHPENSKGDNPDIMFNYDSTEWAIACKAMHSNKVRTLYDTIEKGTDQINKSTAEKGIVIVNFKNIIDRNLIWPITNQSEFDKGEEPIFGCFPSIDLPVKLLKNYGCECQQALIDTIGLEFLVNLTGSGKCPPGFLIFLQAMTAVQHNGECPPTILKTFNFAQFDRISGEYTSLAKRLNEAMHNKI